MDDLMLLLGLSPVGGKLVVGASTADAFIGLGGKNVRAKQLIQRVEHLGCRSG